MLRDLFNVPGAIIALFAVLFAGMLVALAEIGLSTAWSKMYFMFGLPVFVKKIPVNIHRAEIPPKDIFTTRFHSVWASSIGFKKIGPNMYGFREKTFQIKLFSYTPVMHGLLVFDHANHEVVVTGFANWFALGFSLLWFILLMPPLFTDLPAALSFVLFSILVMGFLYAIQYSRFSEVADVAAQAWQYH